MRISNTTFPNRTWRRFAGPSVVLIAAAPFASLAQVPSQYPPAYANQPQVMPQMQQPSALRQVFANTLSSVMQGVSTAASAGVVQGVSGSLVNWFDRQQQSNQPQQYSTYSATPGYGYPATGTYPNSSPSTYSTPPNTSASTYPTYPNSSGAPTYPSTGYATNTPAAGTSTYPTGAGYAYDPNAAQIYDTQTGQLAGSSASAYLTPPSAASYGTPLYAGVAYEVHSIGPNGVATPINPAAYPFRSGDQFLVYYRPSMPGRMDVYNVNPLGQQTRIDSVNMAAGQMTKLGPYQFSATTGEDSLRLVLMPCSTSQLMAATRDIVNVSGSMSAPAAANGFSLSSCTATRSVKIQTRDIAKVAVDGMTSFALDPVSSQEYSSGQLDAREVTIAFHHQ
jgi:hypothetical protein